jgi:hypothetical protein
MIYEMILAKGATMNSTIWVVLYTLAAWRLKQRYSDVVEQSFAVGDAPMLTVDNFAGDVSVHAGDGSAIRVVATKRAAREKDLERIEVRMNERDGAVDVVTDPPSGWKNVSVDLEISVPARGQTCTPAQATCLCAIWAELYAPTTRGGRHCIPPALR